MGASTASTSQRPQMGRRPMDMDVEMTSASQPSNATAASSSSSTEPAHIPYSKSLIPSMRPTIGAYAPHLDSFKKGIQYIKEATAEYEEFHGDPSFKQAGLKNPPTSTKGKKSAGSKSKAALAAQQEKESFSQDPQIHEMEDALQAILDMKYQIEAERHAMDSLTAMIGAGARLPGKDLESSFEILLKNETKHQQTRRKQELQIRPTPGGIDNELWDMRKKVWEVHHGLDPLPSSGAVNSGGGVDEDEDEDMEIVVTADSGTSSLMCPITTNYLQDPVTSSMCKHSFSKEAIVSLIQSRGRVQTTCPVHGCNRPISLDMLQPNKALARKVARQMAIQEEISQREDAEYTTVD
ncbi:hypothetical protein BGZ46_008808 [Entomortierella lignicola]|nr:hypothetical protein BGZ46_008808 [Entomortierella lignicola]